MSVETTRRNGYALVSPKGDIHMRNAPAFRDALLRTVAEAEDVVVDLGGVPRIDTAGLATLVEALEAARREGRRLELAGVGPEVLRMFRLARLDHVFAIRPTVEHDASHDRGGGA